MKRFTLLSKQAKIHVKNKLKVKVKVKEKVVKANKFLVNWI